MQWVSRYVIHYSAENNESVLFLLKTDLFEEVGQQPQTAEEELDELWMLAV